MVFYAIPARCGLDSVSSLGDGYTINVKWITAYPSTPTNAIAYHIYYSTIKEDVYSEGIKYVSIDLETEANIIGLDPGQIYYFSVRPVEYNPNQYDLATLLPIAYDNLRIYPQSLLRSDISATDLVIPLLDTSDFPSTGMIVAGAELIQYSSVNYGANNLLVPGSTTTNPSLVPQVDGYYSRSTGNDGYLIGLTLTSTTAIAETWHIHCIFVQPDAFGNPLPDTAKFVAIGSVSGMSRDGYMNPIIWIADGYSVSNDVFEFSIEENTVFEVGQYFIIQISAGSSTDSGRGYNNTTARSHTTAGYDGYNLWDPTIRYFIFGEDIRFDHIYQCQSRFEYPNFPYTKTDGYHQVTKDLLTTDLSVSDEYNVDFPAYDYAGYHRTDPVQLLNGTCVGSYIGGEMGCIDKYGNVNMLRGLSFQDHNNQRQEVLLNVTGRPAVLIKRVRTGITCACYLPSSEYADDRCPYCHGGKFVLGYQQYFNPRRSDGRILVRPGPADEDLKTYEAGLESELMLDLWTLTVPTIKDRDIIVLFDQDDNEEFRYEVLSVTRNNTIVGLEGGQKFKVQRIRKFDPAYQVRIFRNTEHFPTTIQTSASSGPSIASHTHDIVINEGITSINQINQTTSISQGHNHSVRNGIVMFSLGHKHTITL